MPFVPTIDDCAKSCGLQGLWWYLGQSEEIRHEWMRFKCCWTLWVSLKTARIAAGLSVVELAMKSGVAYKTILRLEKWFSDIEHISLGTIGRIARGCDCAYIVRFLGWPEAIEAYETMPDPRPFNADELSTLTS